jgi:hypothetical protein
MSFTKSLFLSSAFDDAVAHYRDSSSMPSLLTVVGLSEMLLRCFYLSIYIFCINSILFLVELNFVLTQFCCKFSPTFMIETIELLKFFLAAFRFLLYL